MIHPDLTAARAVDACGGTHDEQDDWSDGYDRALTVACEAVKKPDALANELLEALERLTWYATNVFPARKSDLPIINARAVIAKAIGADQ